MNLRFKRLHEAAQLPTRANATDSGMDLYAVEDTVLLPGVPTLVRTGLAVELPDSVKLMGLLRVCKSGEYAGSWVNSDHIDITFEAQIRPRSGLALKNGITVVNSPGTVDNSYRGEIGVILRWDGHNPNSGDTFPYKCHILDWSGKDQAPPLTTRAYRIAKGDRIAQLVVAPVALFGAEWADELSETERAGGGFGSTGR